MGLSQKELKMIQDLLAKASPEDKAAVGLKGAAAKIHVPPERVKEAREAVLGLLSSDYPEVTIGMLNRFKEGGNPVYKNEDGDEWQWNGSKNHKKPDWLKGSEYKFRVKADESGNGPANAKAVKTKH